MLVSLGFLSDRFIAAPKHNIKVNKIYGNAEPMSILLIPF